MDVFFIKHDFNHGLQSHLNHSISLISHGRKQTTCIGASEVTYKNAGKEYCFKKYLVEKSSKLV